MREYLFSHWRIMAAGLFSAVLIVGTFVFVRGIGSPTHVEASTESELLQAIATRDSTGDGLPDWQKSLYGIPLTSTTTDYFNLGMTDGEAVARGLIVPKAISDLTVATSSSRSAIVDPSLPPAPEGGTLTDAFARSFFTLYMQAKQANGGVELTQSQVDALANQSLESLSSAVATAAAYKSARDISVVGSGVDALKQFAISAEQVIQKNKKSSTATKNEISYLQDIIERNDVSAPDRISSIAKMYRDTAAGLAALPVPAELADGDLEFVNAMMRASEIASDFARVNTDPLAAMFALNQYAEVDQSLLKAFVLLGDKYAAAGVAIPSGEAGGEFLGLLNLYRTQAASAQGL